MCYTTPVFAKPTLDEDGHLHVYSWDDIKDCATDWVMHMASQIGAVFFDHDFSQYVQNKESWVDYWKEDNVIIGEDGTSVTFSSELMAYIKQCIDEYAKENEPYFIVPVASYRDVNPAQFATKGQYNTICNLAKEYGLISVNGTTIADLSGVAEEGYSFVSASGSDPLLDKEIWAYMYDNGWQRITPRYRRFTYEAGMVDGYTSMDDGVDPTGSNMPYHDYFSPNYALCHNGSLRNYIGTISEVRKASLVSRDGGRIRVYRTLDDFKRYSVGSRNVYFTENYYNYVPGDLSVSIDDLQKTVDDLKDVLDQLLGQITDNTSEKEIEELLKQILEALKNQGGSSGGDGPDGGDINVDIDLSSTNTLLSKILVKITQIFDKMDAAVEDAGSAAMSKIQESLDEIIVQLKKIKHWTVAGTVIDAADAVADWADLILGILKDAEEGAGSAVAAIATTVGDSVDMMSRKFPFSVPWDILFFVSVLSAEPVMPYFEIPFNFEISALDITIDYTMKLDFSQLQWLSDLSRLLLSMTYAVGLLKMTAGITSAGKE